MLNRKSAFTLAEILITLTIIAVIAVITLSSIIPHYQEKVTVTKVKKMYSTLTTAYDQYMVENNGKFQRYPCNGDINISDAYENIIKPYFAISYDAGTDTEKKRDILPDTYRYLSTNTVENMAISDQKYGVMLKDGSALAISCLVNPDNQTYANSSFVLRYDVNGKKGPNMVGRDIFPFVFDYKGIVPGTCFDKPLHECSKLCLTGNGANCGGYILEYGKMDYFKKRINKGNTNNE